MIRVPGPQDAPRIVELLREMHEETMYSVFPLSEERIEGRVASFLDEEDDYFGRVLEIDGVVHGVFFGHAGQLWFSEAYCGFDDLIYVSKNHRGGLFLPRVLREFGKWCKEKGCSSVLVGISSGVMVERTGRLLETLNYRYLGGLYRRDF